MNKVLVLLSLLLFTFWGKAQQKANYKLAEKLRNVSLGSLIGKYSMDVFPKQINNTDKFWFEFTTEEGKNFYFVDPVKGEKRLFFNNTDIAQGVSLITRKGYNEKDLRISDIELSKDLTKMTFSMDGRYEFDFKTKKVRAVEKDHSEEDDEVIYSWMTFSPDRKYILYAKDHNLYIRGNKAKGIDTTEIQLTTDGEKYYSFARNSEDDRKDEAETNARWFKDSKHIYVVREDSRKLKDMFVINSLTKRWKSIDMRCRERRIYASTNCGLLTSRKKQPTGFRLINGRINTFRLSNPEKKVTSFFSSVLNVHGMKLIFAW